MNKFQPAESIPPSDDKIKKMLKGYQKAHPEAKMTFESLKKSMYEEMEGVPIFVNDKYQVQVRETIFGENLSKDQKSDMIWLSIKRLDKESVHDWRELQQIKNEIVGEKNEGFEIYPSEDRIVDTANQYHLWVFKDPEIKIPVGFFDGRRVSDINTGGVSQQRSFNQPIKVPRRAKRRKVSGKNEEPIHDRNEIIDLE